MTLHLAHPRQSLYLHICSWCRAYYKPPSRGPWNGKPVDISHGICKACHDARFPEEEA